MFEVVSDENEAVGSVVDASPLVMTMGLNEKAHFRRYSGNYMTEQHVSLLSAHLTKCRVRIVH